MTSSLGLSFKVRRWWALLHLCNIDFQWKDCGNRLHRWSWTVCGRSADDGKAAEGMGA